MKRLEDIVQRNRELFDDSSPGDDHFEKFQNKLNQQKVVTVSFTVRQLLKIASVVLIIMALGIWGVIFLQEKIPSKPVMSQEIRDVEFYYTNLVNDRLDSISQFSQAPGLKEDLMKNEFHDIDSIYKVLLKEYKTTPGDERVVEAIIKHYQVKVEILNQILDDLNNIKQYKNKNHESTQI